MALETIIILLCLLGALDSLYTAFQQRFSSLFAYCFTNHFKRVGCDEILHSKYARLFIIPNSWLGIVSYTVLAIVYYYASMFSVVGADRLYYVGIIIATIGLLVSYYLLHIQANVLKKFCIFCLISTTLMTIITILGWTLI